MLQEKQRCLVTSAAMYNDVDGHEFCSHYYLEGQRITLKSYEDVKKLITLAGVFFTFTVLFIFMKLELTVDEIFKWSPVVWLIGILLCCLFMNFLYYCRRIYKRRQLMRIRRQEELLLSLNLATSFSCLPVLSVLPNDLECCNGNGSLRSSMYRSSVISLPSYKEIMAYPHYGIHDVKMKQRTISMTATMTNSNTNMAPPNYDEAIKITA
ncbi:putative potassium transport system protein Kup [Dirofilaria immitis]